MKILVISPQPFFSPRGTPFSVYYRTLISSQLGNEVDLLTYGEGSDVAIPSVKIIRIPRFSRLGNVKVGPSVLKLFLDIFMVLYTLKLLLTKRYDVVHAHEEAVFFCRFLKPIFRFKLIYDMHSSLPQQLTNFKFTTSKFLIKSFEVLENSCLKKADAVITICPDLANYVQNVLGHTKKHFLIENSIFKAIQLADQSSGNTTSSPQNNTPVLPKSRRFVVYAGTLEPYQGIDILISAFSIFHAQHPDFNLLVVGGTSQQVQQYAAQACDCGIEKYCIFTGQVSQSKAKEYCSLAEVQVSPRSNGTNTPLKVYEQIASGIPLVATRIYSHTQVLSDADAILVDPSPEDMATGLSLAIEKEGKEKADHAKELYAEKYSQEVYTGKMEQLFSHLDYAEQM